MEDLAAMAAHTAVMEVLVAVMEATADLETPMEVDTEVTMQEQEEQLHVFSYLLRNNSLGKSIKDRIAITRPK